jgi:hypothetical protein
VARSCRYQQAAAFRQALWRACAPAPQAVSDLVAGLVSSVARGLLRSVARGLLRSAPRQSDNSSLAHAYKYEDTYIAVCGHIYSSMRTQIHSSMRTHI